MEPEIALQKATDKFIRRFGIAERLAAKRGVDMRSCGIETLDSLWNEAKTEAAMYIPQKDGNV
jgi:tetrapyrrole methylase family protein/MazG family protein